MREIPGFSAKNVLFRKLRLFLHISLETLKITDERSVLIPNRIDVLTLVIHTDAEVNLIAVVFQLLHRRQDHCFGLFRMALEDRLADEIVIAADNMIMIFCLPVPAGSYSE